MVLFLAVTAKQQTVDAEDQELPDQVAAGAAAHSASGDDGTADHAAVAGVSEDCARCVHAVAGRKTAFANGDFEVLEAVCAAPTATTTSAPTRTWAESGGRRAGCGCCGRKKGRRGKGKGAAAAAAVASPTAGPPAKEKSKATPTAIKAQARPPKHTAKPAAKHPAPSKKPVHKPKPKPKAKAKSKKR